MKGGLCFVLWFLVAGSDAGSAQTASTPQTPAQPPPVLGTHPIRLELGGYVHHVDRGFGNWRGLEAQLWIPTNPRFIPVFLVDSQTRPTGTQQSYGFFSYLNWTDSFYTTQGFSLSPRRNDTAVYFPDQRYDIKAHWKVPPQKNLILAGGYTYYDLGPQGHGQIFNVGTIYYHEKLVLEGNLFINRNQPGALESTSGSLAAQYGTEGHYWAGVVLSGGRELYQSVSFQPIDIRFSSYSARAFYRKWLSRHLGVVVFFDYQDKLQAYRRVGLSSRIFFEF